ncbi:hypothetical protein B9479_000842 [Cryptococcus floricola]|uniref:DBF4-type domain-containing protein n=1 Tax=Cryptococcus floricola TaxID=2591691 RepID=A0A5D3B6M2_9TREE|nr:hypothetical protein B9479_000842 [Cryptococcus floricola]
MSSLIAREEFSDPFLVTRTNTPRAPRTNTAMSVLSTNDGGQQPRHRVLSGKEESGDIFSQWRKGINPVASKASTPNRQVLATVTNHHNTTTKRAQSPEAKKKVVAKDDASKPLATSQKRQAPATGGTPAAAKRTKLNNERDGVSASNGKVSKADEDKWTRSWVKAFPTLIFYFEIGAEEGPGKTLRSRVIKMGAKVEQFFSTRVTHCIVKESGSPQKQTKPLSQARNSDNARNPFLESGGTTDLAHKAAELHMKVWSVKKLSDILSRVAPVESPVVNNNSLSTLLEDERIHGTRERDATAPRPDHYYFKPGNKHLLIEDATSKHRTIMVKEYTYNARDGPEWPCLYDTFLRISSANQSSVPPSKLRERAWRLYAERQPYGGEQPRDLQRSTSLRALSSTARLPDLPDANAYQDASGNSVVITSNIASTSTPNTPVLAGGMPTLGSNKDRAIMQMSKRVQVLKGNARLAAARVPKESSFSSLGTSAPTSLDRRRSMSQTIDTPKAFLSQDQVIRMLRQARKPVDEEAVSVADRMANRQKVEMGLKGRDQDSAAGYCENCRLKYSDLSVHIASKKHRRFAQNDENFASLDRLLCSLQRPMHPDRVHMMCPPCNEQHTQDWDCEVCNVPPPLPDSENGYDSGLDFDESADRLMEE